MRKRRKAFKVTRKRGATIIIISGTSKRGRRRSRR